jgi:predicted neutral ceramidase superfamily lipid hydrolase
VAIWFVDCFATNKAKVHSMKKNAFFNLFLTTCLWIVLTWIGIKVEPQRLSLFPSKGRLVIFVILCWTCIFWGQRERSFAVMTPKNAAILTLCSLILAATLQLVNLKAISWSLYLMVNGFNGGILAFAMIMWLNCIGNKSNKLVGKLTSRTKPNAAKASAGVAADNLSTEQR